MREMKHSGIEWIGEIPIEWTVKKFKYVANLYTGNSIKDEEKNLYEDSKDAFPYIATKDIKLVFNTVDYENGLYVKNNDLSFVRAYRGDILMCIEGGSAGKKKAKLDRTVCFVNKLCCFHATDIYSNFLYYIMNSPNFEEEFIFNITGLIGGVSKNKLMNFVLPFPPYIEQHHIADVLDEKCAKIDAVIARQQQVIEKLKEYKLSVITEAVTKGLDPTVPMKDSGVEWIGEIPKTWQIKKLKYATTIMRGRFNHRPRNDPDYYDGQYPFVQTGDVARAKKYITDYSQTLNDLGYSVSKEFPSGSIAMTIAANVADVAILTFNACFPDSVVGFVPKNIEPMYLYYALIAMKQQLLRNAIISTQLNLNIEIIKEEFVPIPSKEEQRDILIALDKKNEIIDSAIDKKQAIVNKLTQYKKSLIYEVVTGKREV